jgi:hypothetical protein
VTSPNLDRRHAGLDGAGRKAHSKAVAGETGRSDVGAQTLALTTSDAASPYGSGRIGTILPAMLDSTRGATSSGTRPRTSIVQVTARMRLVDGVT